MVLENPCGYEDAFAIFGRQLFQDQRKHHRAFGNSIFSRMLRQTNRKPTHRFCAGWVGEYVCGGCKICTKKNLADSMHNETLARLLVSCMPAYIYRATCIHGPLLVLAYDYRAASISAAACVLLVFFFAVYSKKVYTILQFTATENKTGWSERTENWLFVYILCDTKIGYFRVVRHKLQFAQVGKY